MFVLCLIPVLKQIFIETYKWDKSNKLTSKIEVIFVMIWFNIKNFHSNLLKTDKKSHEDIDIYYIGYIMIRKFSDYESIHNVNPLYIIIHSATGHFNPIPPGGTKCLRNF